MASPTDTEPVEESRSVSRQQIMLIALLGVALLGAVWFFFLKGGAEPVAAPPPAAAPSDGGGEAAKPKAEPKKNKADKKKEPVESFEVFAPKDPFLPLVSAATSGDTAGDTTGDTSGDTAGDTTGETPGSTDTSAGHTVSLVQIFTEDGERMAQVRVDGTVYRVSQGETFADSFQLVSISGQCAELLFGDDQFSLCEGEEILK